MHPPTPEEQNHMEVVRDTVNVGYAACTVYSHAIRPLMRNDFGSDYFGLSGILTFLMLKLLASADPGMMLYFGVWLIFMLTQRIRAYTLWRRGIHIHSKSGGEPVLMMKLFWIKNPYFAARLEPFFCLLVALLIAPFSEGVASFLFIGMFALAFKTAIDQDSLRRRAIMQRDAEYEARIQADIYNNDRSYF